MSKSEEIMVSICWISSFSVQSSYNIAAAGSQMAISLQC